MRHISNIASQTLNYNLKMAFASSMLRFAGVPEAFNDPFADADFSSIQAPLPCFIPYPGGSGSMVSALKSGDVDAAFLLTECAVAAIANGAALQIVSPLVTSPLRWAICVSPESTLSEAREGLVWGVSRYGSGSHVMVQFLASQRGWKAEPTFRVCKNIDGLLNGVATGEIDAFLWEWYTTSPQAHSGKVKFIGDVPTPWGCFCVTVAVHQSDQQHEQKVIDIKRAVDQFLLAAHKFKGADGTATRIAEKHHMTLDDATTWLNAVEYAQPGQNGLDEKEEERIQKALKAASVIE